MTVNTTKRLLAAAFAGTMLFGAAACGGDDSSTTTTEAAAEGEWDDARLEAARESARGLLGMNEADLADDVRIARRGDEVFALTMDLVPGRLTVELDDTDGSGFRVVKSFVETPDGSEMFELTPG